MEQITWKDFEKIDMRVGTVLEAEGFPEARKPAYKLTIDFGPEIGLRKSSAQLTELYSSEDLIDKKVIAVVNFPPKQIGTFFSECLVLGTYTSSGVELLTPGSKAENGDKIG